MMGSGKTTVGKMLAEVLGYSFCDRFEPSLHVSVFLEKHLNGEEQNVELGFSKKKKKRE